MILNDQSKINPKKDKLGRWRTKSLFKEWDKGKYKSYWTIEELRAIYLTYDHIPGYEYEFAEKEIGDWRHWEFIAERSWLKKFIKEWREALDIKLRALAIQSLVKQAQSTGPGSSQAAKWLAEKNYTSKRGRPSKEELAAEVKAQTNTYKDMAEDARRMRIVR